MPSKKAPMHHCVRCGEETRNNLDIKIYMCGGCANKLIRKKGDD